MNFRPSELDVLSRAFYRTLERLNPCQRDIEDTKTILMTAILESAKRGDFDEEQLVYSGLTAMTAYEEIQMAA